MRTKRKYIPFFAGAIILFGLAAATAEASMISAGFIGAAYADGDDNNPGEAVSDPTNLSWVQAGLGSPLSLSSSASSGGFNAYADGSATWDASGDFVTLQMDDGNSTGGAPANTSGDISSSMEWFYQFTADQTGTLIFNYNTFSSGDTFSLDYFRPNGQLPYNVLCDCLEPLTGSGTLTLTVNQGSTYNLVLSVGENASNANNTLGSAEEQGVFSILLPGEPPSGAPEPGSLFLLGSGLLGLAGTAWRKRKPQRDR